MRRGWLDADAEGADSEAKRNRGASWLGWTAVLLIALPGLVALVGGMLVRTILSN